MERVLPPSILANWKLLREKATATVLDRGILIPHPREDYDLLEERLLESLELRMPRILACGHFHLEEDEEAELLAAGEEIDDDGDDVDICTDCGRRVRDGRHGSGTGSRRWNIKLYAANGLMRAAAWGAAWREMERVDVEICPWISEEMKRELEIAKEAEEQDEALRRASEEETTQHLDSEEDIPIDDRPTTSGLDDARMREIYGDSADAYMEGMYPPPSPSPSSKRSPRPQSAQQRPPSELPLSTLLTNYVTLLAHDPRNVAIALLSLLVLLLAIASRSRSSSSIASAVTSPNEYIPPAPPISNYVADSASTISSSLSSIAPSPSVSPVASALHAEESAKRTMESAVQSEDSAAQTAETEHSDDGGSIPDFADQLEARFEFD